MVEPDSQPKIRCRAVVSLPLLGVKEGEVYTANAFLQFKDQILVNLVELSVDEKTMWFDWGLFKRVESFGDEVENMIRKQQRA